MLFSGRGGGSGRRARDSRWRVRSGMNRRESSQGMDISRWSNYCTPSCTWTGNGMPVTVEEAMGMTKQDINSHLLADERHRGGFVKKPQLACGRNITTSSFGGRSGANGGQNQKPKTKQKNAEKGAKHSALPGSRFLPAIYTKTLHPAPSGQCVHTGFPHHYQVSGTWYTKPPPPKSGAIDES